VAVAGIESDRALGGVTKRGVVLCKKLGLSKLLPSQLAGRIDRYGTPRGFQGALHWFFQRI
jgi:hypothetical protein